MEKQSINVLFLDYDGVVNNIIWDSEGKRATYGWPRDGKVNDFQAVQWIAKLCSQYNFKIVVSSSWRKHENYIECLYNGGLPKSIEVIGRTCNKQTRSHEIVDWLVTTDYNVKDFIIIDDDSFDFNNQPLLRDRFYQVKGDGFYYTAYEECNKLCKQLGISPVTDINATVTVNTEHDKENK